MMKLIRITMLLSFIAISGCGGILKGIDQNSKFATYDSIQQESEDLFLGQDDLDEGLATNIPDVIDQPDPVGDDDDQPTYPPVVDKPDPTEDDDDDQSTNNPPVVVDVPVPPISNPPAPTPIDVPTPPVYPPVVSESLEIEMEPIAICQAGEIDAIRLSMHCYPTYPLILTKKDSTGEAIVENFGSQVNNGENGREKAIERLKTMKWMSEITGNSFDLLLCLDSDGDNSCTDERVIDLNEMNYDLLTSISNFFKISQNSKTEQRLESLEKICANDTMTKVKDGLVFYHQGFKDPSYDVQVSAARVNVRKMTEERMADFVKNFTEETEVREFESGTSVSFSLVEANKLACDKVDKRVHGCYVSGTEIHISEENTMPIEEIQVGYPVLRSNGTVTKVAKIVKGPEEKEVIELKLASGEMVTLTENHPVHTKAGIVLAKDLQEGTRLLNKAGEWQILTSIKKESYQGLVYNIELEGQKDQDHLLFSGGIVTGDLYLQNKHRVEEKNLALSTEK